MTYGISPYLACQWRPWTDYAHFSPQHIQKLRKLVERVLAKEAAETGDTRIVADLEQNSIALVQMLKLRETVLSITMHRSKLEAWKAPAVLSYALRNVKGWTRRRELHPCGNCEHDWRQGQEECT
jgi:hypothetical protein